MQGTGWHVHACVCEEYKAGTGYNSWIINLHMSRDQRLYLVTIYIHELSQTMRVGVSRLL